jgi:casein kinase II subunit beta
MGRFGSCPRVYCEKQHALPIGLCHTLRTGRVKVYCPRCEDIFVPRRSTADIDGAYVGKSFPQLLLFVLLILSNH